MEGYNYYNVYYVICILTYIIMLITQKITSKKKTNYGIHNGNI